MYQSKILIADDNKDTCRDIEMVLAMESDLQVSIDFAYNRDEAIARLDTNQAYDLAILDLWMPDASGAVDKESGLKILERCKQIHPSPEVIIITGYSSSDTALRSMGLGALDYIPRPIDYDILVSRVKQALQISSLEKENQNIVDDDFDEYEIIGESQAMIEVMKQVGRIAKTDEDVFIYGESGTGKDLIARAIHENSPRKDGPFSVLNCTAIPKEQIEAELFGIRKGVATQVDSRPGKFLEATGGTLFLDEIGEISLDIQPKLLRAIEQKEIQGIGKEIQRVDVRIIAATNRDLEEAVAKKLFRSDLYYRLSGPDDIYMPPLRERQGDIQLLANYFLRKYAQKLGKNYIYGFEENVLPILKAYNWPGNVRELKKDIRYTVAKCSGKFISLDDLPKKFLTSHIAQESSSTDTPSEKESLSVAMLELLEIENLKEAREQFEKLFLEWKLNKHSWNVAKTARQIDIARKSLHGKIKRYGLKK
ncbi:TPA: sigma-54-dependent Fis family transcriptional regulator [Candidatus Poribacteria bacterium]|nr:sigma-54-dependent Fis family transcriptional regulator [Candidatus Poribacteria bacterium]